MDVNGERSQNLPCVSAMTSSGSISVSLPTLPTVPCLGGGMYVASESYVFSL